MNWKRTVLSLPLLLVVAGCPKGESTDSLAQEASTETTTPTTGAAGEVEMMPKSPTATGTELTAASDADFALRLLDVLPKDGNMVVGPSSITLALGLLGAGADAPTESMMRQALGIDAAAPWHEGNKARMDSWSKADAPYTLAAANRIYAAENLAVKADYLERSQLNYGAPLERVDFSNDETRKNINSWVGEQTRDMIPELLKPGVIDASTQSVLVNAVYLNAPWGIAFDEALTTDQLFTLADGSTQKVPLMFREGTDIQMGTVDGSTVASVPYAGGELQMLLFLPESSEQLPALQSALATEGLEPWIDSLTRDKTRLFMPRFKVRQQLDLQQAFNGLGLGDIFGVSDFRGIAEGGLTVGKVVHEAVIDVTEEGTEAAAATGVAMVRSMAGPPAVPRIFRADRPFLYAVYDPASESILFTGRYAQPE